MKKSVFSNLTSRLHIHRGAAAPPEDAPHAVMQKGGSEF